MDQENNIVFLKNINEDRSKDIQSIEKYGFLISIVFNNGKKYEYNKDNVKWLTDGKEIDLSKHYVFHKGEEIKDYIKVIVFEDKYYKFKFKQMYKIYDKSDLIIEKNCSKDERVTMLLNYLKGVAAILKEEAKVNENTSEANEKAKDNDFLLKQLEKITVTENSILYNYALGIIPKKKEQRKDTIILPFGSNAAQRKAVDNALNCSISIIQGPPGTGKTQTILNIIANIITRGQKVAVVANNNAATKNIETKLRKHGYDFLSAYLGKKENIKEFFKGDHSLPSDINSWSCESITEAIGKLEKVQEKIRTNQLIEIDLAKLNLIIEELAIEQSAHDASNTIDDKKISAKIKALQLSSDQILILKARLDILSPDKAKSLLTKLKFLYRYGIFDLSKHLSNVNDVMDYLDKQYYKTKLNESVAEKEKLEGILRDNDHIVLEKQSEDLSNQILKHHICERMSKAKSIDTNFDNFRLIFDDFLDRYPIVLSTTCSLSLTSGKGYLYDYVIIDEASQSDIASASIAMSKAKNLIIVGDLMQLPHVVRTDSVNQINAVFSKFSLSENYEYCNNSILDSFTKIYGNKVESVLLQEHYRCDPQIINFCNKRFYDNQLIIRTLKGDNTAITVLPSRSHTERDHANDRQVNDIAEYLPKLQTADIGIIAPYVNQIKLLKEKISKAEPQIETVHGFQGQEKDVIIMSTVSDRIRTIAGSDYTDFLNNPKFLNVAISRAKTHFVLVLSEDLMLQERTILYDFVRYVKYSCDRGEIIKSPIYSVFDLMYKNYSQHLQPLLPYIKDSSDYLSENIMAALIDKICKEKNCGLLNFVANYPLRKIIKTQTLKDEADIKFVSNKNTHCDFVIYSELDKSIRLIIEVDGKQHELMEQKMRDERKDRLLNAAGLKVFRALTTSVVLQSTIEEMLNSYRAPIL